MCTCIDDLEKRIVQEQPIKRLEVILAQFPKSLYIKKGKSELRYQVELICAIKGFKGRKSYYAFITHCPFCGERLYQDDAEH